jgi:16S rRNA (uracil1498-N3)-methyltransferase
MIARLYCPRLLTPGQVVELPAAAAHHARRVLRLADGDAVIVFDGRGGEYDARLAGDGRAAVERHRQVDRETPLAVTLVQSLPSADKMDWVVQKAVELGVAAIQPLLSRRSVVRLSGERAVRRVEHWQQIAVAACEQCGRNRVPMVLPLQELPRYLGAPPAAATSRWILLPGDGEPPQRLVAHGPPGAAASLLVGPEGGFAPDEVASAKSAGFEPRRLGPRILRSETAGLAALAALQALWGDF